MVSSAIDINLRKYLKLIITNEIYKINLGSKSNSLNKVDGLSSTYIQTYSLIAVASHF